MSKRSISMPTPDGPARGYLFAPEGSDGRGLPGILVFQDIWGPRPAIDKVCQTIADDGYLVLLPDLYFRQGEYGPFNAGTGQTDGGREKVWAMRDATPAETTRKDTASFIAALEAAGAKAPFGTVGYCMGGSRALNAAIAYPQTFAAAASIHGGNLAADAPDSPHHDAAKIKATVYVGMAGEDKSFPPEQSARLDTALRTAGLDYMNENYVGAAHGWTMSDNGSHHPEATARHHRRLKTLFGEAL